MIPMFPKPGQIKKKPEPERVYSDGRTKLNLNTKEGMDRLIERKRAAWERQGRICYLCRKPLPWKETTAEHILPKKHGGSAHDDRAENIAAACFWCNAKKGSRRDYVSALVP
jgi:5-methylcytosine-specific restriction endonuclease McrA